MHEDEAFEGEDEEDVLARQAAHEATLRFCSCSRARGASTMVVCKDGRACNGCVTAVACPGVEGK